jgi:hypothetical protein
MTVSAPVEATEKLTAEEFEDRVEAIQADIWDAIGILNVAEDDIWQLQREGAKGLEELAEYVDDASDSATSAANLDIDFDQQDEND